MQKSATKMLRMTVKIKPLASINKAKADATYVLNSALKIWSRITSMAQGLIFVPHSHFCPYSFYSGSNLPSKRP